MKYAISNIALPAYNHQKEIIHLAEMGFQGLEVAPSRIWEDTKNISFSKVQSYRRQVENAGLKIIGLHSLFFDQPGLGLFRGEEVRIKTINYLFQLSKICSDLGGKILIFGSPQARRRNILSLDQADNEIVSFFSELCLAIENHGTFFCIEPLGPNETDYIDSAMYAFKITKCVNRKQLKSHLDAKALFASDEANPEVFKKLSPTLVHFHANEPGLGILGETGEVDHALLGRLLKEINYQRYVSIEQKMVSPDDPLMPVQNSIFVLKRYYKS